ncbi:hypothetical protein [Leptospira weilii]|uniref:hypothetical protein n=1 Tax=Leptospira weilii TaxID=28184 RepID=UPI0002BF290D|nr:hypothetical protein [Leptospira weilii]EMN44746.1 hypothetical protein LEP1GSC086_4215 [Leptospira weilii str. LNT 1234]QDK21559.1 hypothetical protein FHG67_01365 [Leptospira weilii]QDK24963.1 hypothetical protein FHG67_19815 [Leptospira weilii]QDK25523.1 hypothetical protein FHG68_01375 [Leptospira weilii]
MKSICLVLLFICACTALQKTGNEAIYESAKADVETLPPSKEKRNIQKALDVCGEQNEELKELREENLKLQELANKWKGLRNSAIAVGIFAVLGLVGVLIYKFRNLLGAP